MKKQDIIKSIIILVIVGLSIFYFYNKKTDISLTDGWKKQFNEVNNFTPTISSSTVEKVDYFTLSTSSDIGYAIYKKGFDIVDLLIQNDDGSTTTKRFLTPYFFIENFNDVIKSMSENTSACPETYTLVTASSNDYFSSKFYITKNCIYASQTSNKITKLKLIAKDNFNSFNFLPVGFTLGYYLYQNNAYYIGVDSIDLLTNFKEASGLCDVIEYGPIFIYYPSQDGFLIDRGQKTEVSDSICEGVPTGLYKGNTKVYYLYNLVGGMIIDELNGLNSSTTVKIGEKLFTDGNKTVRIDSGNGMDGTFWDNVIDVNISDISTYKELGPEYAVDSVNVYYKGKAIVGADSKTFKVLYDEKGGFEGSAVSIGRDNYSLWYENYKIMEINPATEITFKGNGGDWTDRSIHFSDGQYNYIYNGPGDLVKEKI